jgi:hypothetical protein
VSAHPSINHADLFGLQFAVVEIEQIGPANGVDQYRAILDGPPLEIAAIAVATDLQARSANKEVDCCLRR